MGHPGEMVFEFHWAPIAGSTLRFGTVYDGIFVSLRQAG